MSDKKCYFVCLEYDPFEARQLLSIFNNFEL